MRPGSGRTTVGALDERGSGMSKIVEYVTSERTKLALILTTCIVLAVVGLVKYMETDEVLWATLGLPLFAIIAAAI
jgi:hypothetical protein